MQRAPNAMLLMAQGSEYRFLSLPTEVLYDLESAELDAELTFVTVEGNTSLILLHLCKSNLELVYFFWLNNKNNSNDNNNNKNTY